jgi:hypothetical protein
VRELRAVVLTPEAEPAPAPAAAPEPPPVASQRAWTPPPAEPVPRVCAKQPSLWDREVTIPKVDLADLLGAG